MARNRAPLAVMGRIQRGLALTTAEELHFTKAKKPIDVAPDSDWLQRNLKRLDALRMRSDQDTILRSQEP